MQPTESSLLKNSSFFYFLIVRICSSFASQMVGVAVGWQIYEITKSTFYLGLVGLVQFVPMIVLTPVVGYVADRFNRKIIMSICQAGMGICFIYLALGSFGGWLSRDGILIAVFFFGLIGAFQGPSMQSMLPNIVEKEVFPQATAVSTSVFQAVVIIGPALGGILYGVSPWFVYALSAVFAFTTSGMILPVKLKNEQSHSEPATLKSIMAGFFYIRRQPVILGAISLDLFAVLFGGATALLPVYADSILKVGAFGLGLLRSAPAVGALLISIVMGKKPVGRRVGMVMFAAVMVFGFSTIGFAVSTSFVLSLFMLFFLGASDVISVVIRATLVQMKTPDVMRGRVSSVNQVFINTSNQLGEFESGMMATWFGTVPAAVVGGVGTIAVVAIWMLIFPQLRKINTYDELQPEEA